MHFADYLKRIPNASTIPSIEPNTMYNTSFAIYLIVL